MATEERHFAYVGIAPCGCMQAATVDNPDHRKDVARDVREFMTWGHVERVPVELVRVRLCMAQHQPDCPHPHKCPEAKRKSEAGTREAVKG